MRSSWKQVAGWSVAIISGIAGGQVAAKTYRFFQMTRSVRGDSAQACATGNATLADGALYRVSLGDSPSVGPRNAKVTIVEFSDYECPFCAKAATAIHRILENHSQTVRLVFKHSPLPMHSHAAGAAKAAIAAGAQGKFWEMSNLMFAQTFTNDSEQQEAPLDGVRLEEFGRKIGLDLARWREDVTSQRVLAVLDGDRAQASSLQIRSAPVFFINGIRLSGLQEDNKFEKAVEDAINRADALLAKGVKSEDLYEKVVALGKLPVSQ